METLKKFTQFIFKNSPGYEPEIDEERTKTSKILYARKRVSFTRLFAPGIHIEAEDYIMDKRLKGGILRHFRYLGPRGEILFYGLFAFSLMRLCRVNIDREHQIENLLNDRNVYLKINMSYSDRKID